MFTEHSDEQRCRYRGTATLGHLLSGLVVGVRQPAVAALVAAFTMSAPTQGPDPSIKDVVIGLGQAGVPAGVVLSLREFVNAEKQSAMPRRPTAVPSGAAAAADAALNLFIRNHPVFALDRSAQGVRLVRKDTPAEVMRRLTRAGEAQDRPDISASAALVQVVGTLIRQQPTAGVLGSGPVPGEGCPLNAPVKIAPRSTTALDALDAIVAQVPGLSWFVLYEEGRAGEKLDVGLWCPDGMHFRVELTLGPENQLASLKAIAPFRNGGMSVGIDFAGVLRVA